MTARRGQQGRHFEATNPVTVTLRIAEQGVTPVGGGVAAGQQNVVPNEPDASIGHVRVCGGAGRVTAGSTRQATAYSVRCAPASRRA